MLGKPINTDSWDGYPAARNRLLDFIEHNHINNAVILTGDVHSSWAANICKDPYDWRKYNRFTHDGAVAVEIVTSSVTSPSIPVPGLQQLVGDVGKILMPENPHIRYIDLANRGFVTWKSTKNDYKPIGITCLLLASKMTKYILESALLYIQANPNYAKTIRKSPINGLFKIYFNFLLENYLPRP